MTSRRDFMKGTLAGGIAVAAGAVLAQEPGSSTGAPPDSAGGKGFWPNGAQLAVEAYPELAAEVVRRGHEAAGHGLHWAPQYSLTPAEERRQYEQASAIIERVTGQRPRPTNPAWRMNARLSSRCQSSAIRPSATRWALGRLWSTTGVAGATSSPALPGLAAALSSSRRLERDGLVERQVYPTVPPTVEYALTELGATLGGTVERLAQWAESNMPAILLARQLYDQYSE
ncbi:hypothetical protein WR25_20177 [Diploscapter pachys]|uniref:HTH hxlR-type domain-containing protein n=1 Tax=Diploscapter pachys TaxID=2018661 RepID=A0A2A2KBY6_9BILA|nr:hypothetical protein WR25_20177 [Diploscapter pachys]